MKVLLFVSGCLLLFSLGYAGRDGKPDDKPPKRGGHGKDNDMGKELRFNQTRVKVSGKSGKIRLWKEEWRNEDSSQTNKTKSKSTAPIFIFYDEMSEIDTEGKAIVGEKNAKHSFKSFASQEFAFGNVTQGTIPSSTVKAQYIEYSGKLKGLTSTLKSKVYVLEEDGEVTLDGEVTRVLAGEMKFTVSLSNWEWCVTTTCDGVVGEYIDLVIAIGVPKGRKIRAASTTRPKKFDLGKNAFIDFSSKVEIDGVWQNMSTGFPKYEEKGAKRLFTLRFPRFNKTAHYDPYADSGNDFLGVDELPDPETYDPNPDGGQTSGASNGIISVATLLTSVIAAWLHRPCINCNTIC